MYDLDETIRERRSARGFLPKPVPRKTLEDVLALAQHRLAAFELALAPLDE